MRKTGPTNPALGEVIQQLKIEHSSHKVNLWNRIAQDLEKSSRKRRVVNLSRINRHAKENETVIVPGKVLGTGSLERSLTIVAFAFSASAKESIEKANGKCLSIQQLLELNPKGQKVRIIG